MTKAVMKKLVTNRSLMLKVLCSIALVGGLTAGLLHLGAGPVEAGVYDPGPFGCPGSIQGPFGFCTFTTVRDFGGGSCCMYACPGGITFPGECFRGDPPPFD